MKKLSGLIVVAVIACVFLMAYSVQEEKLKPNPFYPSKVHTVVDNKCYGCHSAQGKSDDAKEALMWDSLPGLPRRQMLATLDEIIEVLEDNAMPPEDVVKKYPQMKLSDADKSTLMKWANAKADSLLKK